jgi:hypothetical protein
MYLNTIREYPFSETTSRWYILSPHSKYITHIVSLGPPPKVSEGAPATFYRFEILLLVRSNLKSAPEFSKSRGYHTVGGPRVWRVCPLDRHPGTPQPVITRFYPAHQRDRRHQMERHTTVNLSEPQSFGLISTTRNTTYPAVPTTGPSPLPSIILHFRYQKTLLSLSYFHFLSPAFPDCYYHG